jgi:hypothetical protein
MSHFDRASRLLDELLCGSMAEAARRVGISPSLPFKWVVQSKLGHPELQAIEFCGVVAPFHVHYGQNVPALAAQQVQQTALERARDGVLTDVFFQGVRMFERTLKPEYTGKSDDDLRFEIGPDFERECYETKPTKQWLKPSDALVIKMLEAWNRKRYGSHQTIDVNYGGVLRLEKDNPDKTTPKVIEAAALEVFEAEPEAQEAEGQRGAHLALAPPAKSSADFEARAAAGEFDQAPVAFLDANGQATTLRPDIEELRQQAAELRRNGPVHKRPEGRVQIFKPEDEPRIEPQKPEPIPQTVADHPRAYSVPKPQAPRPVAPYTGGTMGDGREGVGPGPDPRRDERGNVGFSISRG